MVEKKEIKSWQIVVLLSIAFCVGVGLGIVMEGDYDFFENEGTLLTIGDAELGVIYNKIENPYFCMIQKEGLESSGKAYLLPPDCPSRFNVAISGDGEYEIVTAPLPPTIQKE
ncbi:hypothetical protein KAJ61_05710 [Candidatus Parcubacteria bacterium]|nr:hypothetical protein [Candidatus Parcubacteria bacterium]